MQLTVAKEIKYRPVRLRNFLFPPVPLRETGGYGNATDVCAFCLLLIGQPQTVIMPILFLNYRRDDSAGHAGRLFDRLEKHYGRGSVFMDVSGKIEPGEPFHKAIERAVESCDVLLAVIGQQWVTGTNRAGKRRIDDPADFVRLEIAKALQRNIRVIPVLVQRASMPAFDDLPPDLQPLTQNQAVELTDSRWDFDVSQLIAGLDRLLRPPKPPRKTGWIIAAAVGLLLAIGGFAVWKASQNRDAAQKTADTASDTGTGTASKPSDTASTTVPQKTDTVRSTGPQNTPSGSTSTQPNTGGGNGPSVPEPKLMAVPDLRGLTLEAASGRLAGARLSAGRKSYYTLGRYGRGVVYNQEITPGTLVPGGTAVGLYVESGKAPGIQSAGVMYMSPTEVWDLDGEGTSREEHDIRFSTAGNKEWYVEPLNGARLAAMGRTRVDQGGCAAA